MMEQLWILELTKASSCSIALNLKSMEQNTDKKMFVHVYGVKQVTFGIMLLQGSALQQNMYSIYFTGNLLVNMHEPCCITPILFDCLDQGSGRLYIPNIKLSFFHKSKSNEKDLLS